MRLCKTLQVSVCIALTTERVSTIGQFFALKCYGIMVQLFQQMRFRLSERLLQYDSPRQQLFDTVDRVVSDA